MRNDFGCDPNDCGCSINSSKNSNASLLRSLKATWSKPISLILQSFSSSVKPLRWAMLAERCVQGRQVKFRHKIMYSTQRRGARRKKVDKDIKRENVAPKKKPGGIRPGRALFMVSLKLTSTAFFNARRMDKLSMTAQA